MATLKATVEMLVPNKLLATGYSGATWTLHVPGKGEPREGPSPFETVVLAAGGCTALDVIDILRKEREPLESLRIELEAVRAKGPPAVLETLHLTYVVKGPRNEANVKRAIDLSQEKYCSVSIMLKRAGVAVTTGYRLET